MMFRLCICISLLIVGCAAPRHSEPPASVSAAPRSVASFAFIGLTTTMQQVFAAVGHEDRVLGSGLTIYEYRLSDGTYIWIGSTRPTHIVYVRHGRTLDESELLHLK